MPERVAMTPPDRDGQQVFWQKSSSVEGNTYIPYGSDEEVRRLLVPETYTTGDEPNLIGIGSLAESPDVGHVEASHVHLRDGYAVKSAPFITEERLLDWLSGNLMLKNALLKAGEAHPFLDSIKLGQAFRVRTPSYLGAMSINGNPHTSLVVMSYEGPSMDSRDPLFKMASGQLEEVVTTVIELIYPGYAVAYLDHWSGNWVFDPKANEFVRLDITGLTNLPVRLPFFNTRCD